MGRPRGKSKKLSDESDEDGSGGGEEVSVSPAQPKNKRRRGRPAHKPLTADDGTDDVKTEDDKDTGEVKVEDADDGAKLAVRPAGNDDDGTKQGSTAETGAGKKRRRRRRVKEDPVEEDGEDHVKVKANSSGFRPNGSRRKSTPRRAAEAGVECK
ncbi:hypothetical protein BDA96_07G223000 [Sorghum bicolor]|jgi:hypothetical protein|uniref:Uncharacterized protein n=2 Tax=Sorghum bicolor TaxID=4558 RepID=C5YIR9_SORBI|nr:uncharacterized protein LOC8055176 [Sorghum bicolor]EES14265.1 hypothetical protein SORBI_3007G210100 [Sorghum bicolor]KAG0524570.1 hypothetical protein BDA96_07G223000 [Sorghum bicolor]OQU80923.1 hypothetical protein SORBI_3007G210100 [Sorghum bicolor]|eukprot:XP_002444770.1 uncharacterized protein LOC8055176 [Sorghum bicolor]